MKLSKCLRNLLSTLIGLTGLIFVCVAVGWAQPKPATRCAGLPSHPKLRSALEAVLKLGKDQDTEKGNSRRAALVKRDGGLCAIEFGGESRADQWQSLYSLSTVAAPHFDTAERGAALFGQASDQILAKVIGGIVVIAGGLVAL